MLGWSINLFRIRGIQLAVHWTFLGLLTWVAGDGWHDGRFLGLLWSATALIAFFSCIVLHELGHSFTAMHFGIGVRRILLTPIGGIAEFDAIPRQPARELLITFAGPAVNFAIAGVLWLIVGIPHGSDFPATTLGFAQLLLRVNFILGCFNLLPAFPMDGGRILRAALASRMPYLAATRLAATVGKIVCVLAIGLAILWPGFEVYANRLTVCVLFTFIFFVGEAEYRAVRQREIDDARWREMLARAYGAQAPSDPPLLPR